MLGTALLGAVAVVLAGCSDVDHEGDDAVAGEGFPVTVENCGEKVTMNAAPQRIVSMNQGTTEVLLSLGLADRVVGTATWTDPILDSLAGDNEGIKRLADNKPSLEAVLAENPDFVTASFSSTLGDGGVATRARFDELKVPNYLAPSDCEGKVADGGDGTRESPASLDQVYKEITQLGELTGTSDKATSVIDDLKGRVTAAQKSVNAQGVSVLYWFANAEQPYIAGCCGAPGIITNTLGLKNVFDDTKAEWPQVSWEAVASRNPQVLVLGDLTRKSQTAETGEAKIRFLETNPVTREMDAVKNKRYILVTGAEMNPSLRTVYGIQNVADGLVELGLSK
ncbi:ABC transporter substrate-binding protein [Gordonia pseudamarae]|jgi:iron complex transport system substrate-binding protein